MFDRVKEELESVAGVEDISAVDSRGQVAMEVDTKASAGPNQNRASSKMERIGFREEQRVSGSSAEGVPRGTTVMFFEPQPEKINSKLRSPEARASDRGKDAQVTADPLEWAKDPSRHDFPGVDTGPMFEESFDGDFEDF